MLMLSVKDEKEAELYLSAPALQAENKALKDMLRKLEWLGVIVPYCHICKNTKRVGHAPDCRLAALLKEE
jgi:hypothetical protein